MNRFLPLLLILVFLTGCAAQEPAPSLTDIPPSDFPEPSAPFMECIEDGRSIPKYALPDTVSGFLPVEENLLFFSGSETTVLTLVAPTIQQVLATYETGIALTTENVTVRLTDAGISYFDAFTGETVVLNNLLQEIRRIAAPENLTGMPLLTRDGNTLYYCTASAIRALDRSTGISRVLREASYPVQEVSGLLLEDSVLQISITEADGSRRTLFLSAETGQLLEDQEGNILPETAGQRYFLRQQKGNQNTFLFGFSGENPMVLTPWFAVDDAFFLADQVLTSFVNQGCLELHLYSLDSGLRTSSFLGLSSETILLDVAQAEDAHIWLLCRQQDGILLYHWDPDQTRTKDTACYICPRYTRQEPDLDALAACSLYARELSHRHGVEILVYTDAVALQPWDYELECEYDAPALYQELELLDRRLQNYPAGFLENLRNHFSGIKICIVRSIRGTPESGSVDIAGGIQFWDGYDAYIVLAAGHDTEQTLYHELCHLIDTVVLTESTAYDQWDKLNPPGFRYANTYTHAMSANDWRQAGWESFLDDYSLTYPKEDRARIMEYAMTEGHRERFESPYLQTKLKLLCTGIREAFGLESLTVPLLWEQYLQLPLAPNA